jgi:hypothetical protein
MLGCGYYRTVLQWILQDHKCWIIFLQGYSHPIIPSYNEQAHHVHFLKRQQRPDAPSSV